MNKSKDKVVTKILNFGGCSMFEKGGYKRSDLKIGLYISIICTVIA